MSVASGGTLSGSSATLDVTGDWSCSGSFSGGTGAVRFVDGCGTTVSTVSDSNTFNDLELTTGTGKQVRFETGATTTVNGMFEVSGASGNLLEIRSTLDGSEAFLGLAAANMGDFVDAKDNHAIGAPVLLTVGSLLSGNTLGWTFGLNVPGLEWLGLAALCWSLLASGRRLLR